MTYKYKILKISNFKDINFFEDSINIYAKECWHIRNIQFMSELKGRKLNGEPEIEFYFLILMEKNNG